MIRFLPCTESYSATVGLDCQVFFHRQDPALQHPFPILFPSQSRGAKNSRSAGERLSDPGTSRSAQPRERNAARPVLRQLVHSDGDIDLPRASRMARPALPGKRLGLERVPLARWSSSGNDAPMRPRRRGPTDSLPFVREWPPVRRGRQRSVSETTPGRRLRRSRIRFEMGNVIEPGKNSEETTIENLIFLDTDMYDI